MKYKLFVRDGVLLLLRDDGFRIHFRALDGKVGNNVDRDEWIMWAEYKQCDFPGFGGSIANELMSGSIELPPVEVK